MPSLLYIADPMCSWCYGFGPELHALLDGLPGLPLHVVAGGLRTGSTQPASPELKASLQEHWHKVAERTGLPFSTALLERDDFVYDTEPACRAVVTARALAPQASLAVFSAIQQGFYAQGQDVTRGEVLAQLACAALNREGIAIDPLGFLAHWENDDSKAATQADFEQVQRWEIQGFPTLVLERDGQLDLIAAGYVPLQTLVERMESLVNDDDSSNAD